MFKRFVKVVVSLMVLLVPFSSVGAVTNCTVAAGANLYLAGTMSAPVIATFSAPLVVVDRGDLGNGKRAIQLDPTGPAVLFGYTDTASCS